MTCKWQRVTLSSEPAFPVVGTGLVPLQTRVDQGVSARLHKLNPHEQQHQALLFEEDS